MEITPFTCSICGESSHEICVYCTKDACRNHLCDRCHRCSDCCECEIPMNLGYSPNGHEASHGVEEIRNLTNPAEP